MTIERILVALLAAAPLAATAHHGWNEYDASRPLTVTGTVAESGWEHPHGYVKLAAADKTWIVVLAPPSRMENRGMQRAAIAPGATVTVEGYQNRNKPDEMRAERITAAGRTTELR
jgi:hypothetical protein